MRQMWWMAVLVAVVACITGVALGRYVSPISPKPVDPTPTSFFQTFNPRQHAETATKDKLNWKVVSNDSTHDEPVRDEYYGNPPYARTYAHRTTRIAAAVTPEQWKELRGDGLSKLFFDLKDTIRAQGEDAGGGQFGLGPVSADPAADDPTPWFGTGYMSYGGKGGISSHHGLITYSVVKAGNRVEIVFFIRESWPRHD